jgi:hypothetical protein
MAVTTAASQRVHEAMRRGIARYELFRAHVEGDPEHQRAGCAQCLETDLNPRRVRAWCEAGRDLHSAVLESIAIASTLISQARTRAGLKPTVLGNAPFSLADHIKRFYEWEFEGPLTPRPRKPAATLPKRMELTPEQMAELKADLKTPKKAQRKPERTE